MPIELRFLGHSGFLINISGTYVMIDPFITGNPLAYTIFDSLNITDILVTHGHGDHLGDSIRLAKKYNATISTIFELANYCSKKGTKVQGVNMGGIVPFKWGNVNWLPAAHSSSTPDGEYAGSASSVLLTIGNKKIYHAGDTGLHYEFRMIGEFYKPDIALLPIGGFFTMGIDEAVQATKWLNCSQVIPMHYDTFTQIETNVQEFQDKIEKETKAKCIILEPGKIHAI